MKVYMTLLIILCVENLTDKHDTHLCTTLLSLLPSRPGPKEMPENGWMVCKNLFWVEC